MEEVEYISSIRNISDAIIHIYKVQLETKEDERITSCHQINENNDLYKCIYYAWIITQNQNFLSMF